MQNNAKMTGKIPGEVDVRDLFGLFFYIPNVMQRPFTHYSIKPYSAVVASMIALTLLMELAGKPPCVACSRIISSLGAM
jgi:hypothetical protein